MSAAMFQQGPTDHKPDQCIFPGVSETPVIESRFLPCKLAIRYPGRLWNSLMIITIIIEYSSSLWYIRIIFLNGKVKQGVAKLRRVLHGLGFVTLLFRLAVLPV